MPPDSRSLLHQGESDRWPGLPTVPLAGNRAEWFAPCRGCGGVILARIVFKSSADDFVCETCTPMEGPDGA